MKLMITGTSGMVGKNITEHPAMNNYDVLGPNREELDLLDYGAVQDYIERNRPDFIIHCAGTVGGIQANINEPFRFLYENLDMGRNVILAAKKTGIKKLMNMGSSCMYPRNASNPLTEDTILTGELEPTNEGYALAKITVAKLCEYITRENSEYQYKTIIPCNLYGRWDKFDPIHSHMISAVILKIHEAKNQDRREITIWGDGTARREFMYAGDLADFTATAIERFEELPFIMNIGLGYDYSIDQYYEMIAKVLEYDGKFVHDLSKPVGMKQKLVDNSRLRKFGWHPGNRPESGIQKTFAFYLQQCKNRIG